MRLLPLAAFVLLSAAPALADTIEEKAAICSACHGEAGVPQDKAAPIIWGQNEGYIYLELRDMQKGARKNELMASVVETLSKDDMLALAQYFSAKPWPALSQPSASKDDQKTALRVNGSIGCTGCHNDNYRGDSSVPRTAGQQHDYLLKAMTDFRDQSRANNPGMSDLMKAATPGELAAMANYLAGL
jgi:cytochrome c553